MNRTSQSKSDSVTNIMLKEVAKTKVLSREEEQVLFQQYKTASPSMKEVIRKIIVKSNLRFVLKIALHYKHTIGANVNDIMSEGKIGLIIAVDKFNPDRGIKFISFAVWWIRSYISKYLEENDLIKLPPNQKMRINKLRKKSVDDIELDSDDRFLIQLVNQPTSLDSPIDNESDLYLKDVVHDENASNGDTDWTVSRVSEDLDEIMDDVLNNEEKFIVSCMYGLTTDGDSLTLRETNEYVGKSRERVRQIRERALKKLKRNSNIRDLYDSLCEVNA